jgi:hypothetical protein
MPVDRHIRKKDPHQVYVQARSAPRCYTRTESRAASQPRSADFDGGMILLVLSIFTAVAAFWLAYRGWRF